MNSSIFYELAWAGLGWAKLAWAGRSWPGLAGWPGIQTWPICQPASQTELPGKPARPTFETSTKSQRARSNPKHSATHRHRQLSKTSMPNPSIYLKANVPIDCRTSCTETMHVMMALFFLYFEPTGVISRGPRGNYTPPGGARAPKI